MNSQEITAASGSGTPPATGAGEIIDERMALVQRVAASPQFRRAVKLRDFLVYVVEQTVQGQGDTLNEQQIGRAVFARAADYSPSEDNVVRAHARQLRVKLGEYFSATGKDEPLILEIPKGSYVPVFSQRPAAPEAPAAESPEPVPGKAPLPPRVPSWLVLPVVIGLLGVSAFLAGGHYWLAIAIAAGSLGGSAILAFQNWTLERQVAASGGAPASTMPAPLAWVFEPDHSASLVVADSCFGLMQDLAGRPASLEEYLDTQFWHGKKLSSGMSSDHDRLMRRISSRELTSYADLLLASRIVAFASPRAKVSIRFARDLRPRELSSGNFIFLGSCYANPWVDLYERKRNFRIQIDASSRQSVINRDPRPGERASYFVMGEDGVPGVTYGLIAYCPSDGVTGNVLLIEGTNMEGTEAAGGLILDPKSARDILSLAGIPFNSRSHPFFEFLIETKVLAGEPSQTRVVAWRK